MNPLFFTVLFLIPLNGDYELFKVKVIQLVNEYRLNGCNCGNQYMKPVTPLNWNDALGHSAAVHAIDMEKNHYFSHQSFNGMSISGRISQTGYDWGRVAENIAYGQTNLRQVIEGWMESPSHCINIMNPDFRDLGVAKKGKYWVMDLGVER
ncbi:MAG: CAP domain-containing protein [Bacteroidetes bacterium]|nr:CAP domain-containing protein [Bacteroidota bacterium]